MPKLVWRVWAPSKIKFFLWLFLQERVWTADRLQRRGWPNEYFCQLCRRNLETTAHLAMECPIVHHLWQRVATWVRQLAMLPEAWEKEQSTGIWYDNLVPRQNNIRVAKGLRSIVMLTIWTIWNERNARVFKREEKSVRRKRVHGF